MPGRWLIGSCALVPWLVVASLGAAGSDLADAVMRGDRGAVRALLQRGADPNAYNDYLGGNPLSWAAQQPHLDVILVLLGLATLKLR